jgi:magnesium transporter
VLLPLTLIASVWGMNVHVPGEGNLAAFWIIVAAMAAILVALTLYFRRRGWL